AYVLDSGNVVAEGTAQELLKSRNIAESYLGR
ncbi:uncharacterized protein METZ01_LOCUS309646, partial [marine metagenome]